MKKKKNHGKAVKYSGRQPLKELVDALNLDELNVSQVQGVLGGVNVIGLFSNAASQVGHGLSDAFGHVKSGVSRYWNNLTPYQAHALLGTVGLAVFTVAGLALHGRGEANAPAELKSDLELGSDGKPIRKYTVSLLGKSNGVFIDSKGEIYAQDPRKLRLIYDKDGKEVSCNFKIDIAHPITGANTDARRINIRKEVYGDDLKKLVKNMPGRFVGEETGQIFYIKIMETNPKKCEIYNINGKLLCVTDTPKRKINAITNTQPKPNVASSEADNVSIKKEYSAMKKKLGYPEDSGFPWNKLNALEAKNSKKNKRVRKVNKPIAR